MNTGESRVQHRENLGLGMKVSDASVMHIYVY